VWRTSDASGQSWRACSPPILLASGAVGLAADPPISPGNGCQPTAELLVSELVTNAIHASGASRTAETPVVRVWVTSDGLSIVIHVWDASAAMPVRQTATAADDEGGRGLLLVETLSKDWGTYRKAAGKVVWVMITAADP
jgi:anti-sigma regulatory factor (Ser/Thr protein kinase)